MSQKGLTPLLLLAFYTFLMLSLYPLESSPLRVTTSRKLYDVGDTIVITVEGPAFSDVALELRNPMNVVVYVDQARLSAKGQAVFQVTVPRWWVEGKYTLYVAVPGRGRSFTQFMVLKREKSQLLVHTQTTRISVGEPLTLYIFLNPPLSEKILVEIFWGSERKHLVSANIPLTKGFAKYSLKFNSSGVYFLKFTWPGNLDYRGSSTELEIRVTEERAPSGLNCTIEISVRELMYGDYVEFKIGGIKPGVGTYILLTAPNGILMRFPLKTTVFRFRPNLLGMWSVSVLLVKGESVLSCPPQVFYVKNSSKLILTAEHYELKPRQATKLIVHVFPEGRQGVVDFYVLLNGSWKHIGSSKIVNDIASITWLSRSEGEFKFKASWKGDAYYFGSESNIISINVKRELIPVVFEIVDSKGRLLKNSTIIIGKKAYLAKNGTYRLYLEKQSYTVTVVWRGVMVFNATVNVTKPERIALNCEVYDVKIVLKDFLQTPVSGQTVVLVGRGLTLVGITDNNGVVIFTRVPKGNYTLKIGGKEIHVMVECYKTVDVVQPPPTYLVALAIIITIVIVWIVCKFIKIEILS